MAGKLCVCRHCGEAFIPQPGKPGYIDECPECLVAKAMEAGPSLPSQLEELMVYIAAHPVTVDRNTGLPIKWKTRLELRQKLERKKFSPAVIEKLVSAYMAAVIES
jgi:hypothetical protein